MRLALLILGALVVYAVIGLAMIAVIAPVEFYAGELQDWLANRVGEEWAIRIAAVAALIVGLPLAIGVLYAPLALLARYGRKQWPFR